MTKVKARKSKREKMDEFFYVPEVKAKWARRLSKPQLLTAEMDEEWAELRDKVMEKGQWQKHSRRKVEAMFQEEEFGENWDRQQRTLQPKGCWYFTSISSQLLYVDCCDDPTAACRYSCLTKVAAAAAAGGGMIAVAVVAVAAVACAVVAVAVVALVVVVAVLAVTLAAVAGDSELDPPSDVEKGNKVNLPRKQDRSAGPPPPDPVWIVGDKDTSGLEKARERISTLRHLAASCEGQDVEKVPESIGANLSCPLVRAVGGAWTRVPWPLVFFMSQLSVTKMARNLFDHVDELFQQRGESPLHEDSESERSHSSASLQRSALVLLVHMLAVTAGPRNNLPTSASCPIVDKHEEPFRQQPSAWSQHLRASDASKPGALHARVSRLVRDDVWQQLPAAAPGVLEVSEPFAFSGNWSLTGVMQESSPWDRTCWLQPVRFKGRTGTATGPSFGHGQPRLQFHRHFFDLCDRAMTNLSSNRRRFLRRSNRWRADTQKHLRLDMALTAAFAFPRLRISPGVRAVQDRGKRAPSKRSREAIPGTQEARVTHVAGCRDKTQPGDGNPEILEQDSFLTQEGPPLRSRAQ
ncbi:cmlA [Symbiodinium natans]|uniref:CmlA protein n=1 Tax=Symbiodinium natans TaxID=878477 RepID=A0A812N330_9DINO|nr:cmlA [Symbiodinium natans]